MYTNSSRGIKLIAWVLISVRFSLQFAGISESQMQLSMHAAIAASVFVSRKLPFLALSLYCPPPGAGPVPLPTFLAALTRAANRMQHDLTATNAVFSHI
jgi:hypothetical protein